MIKDTFTVMKKEFLELRTSIIHLLPMIVLILLPVVAIAMNVGGLRAPLIPKEMIVFLAPCILGGSIAYELTQNNIAHERRERTLDILLVSDISRYSIVIGKAMPGVIVGSILTISMNMVLCLNNDYRLITEISNLLLTPFLIYLIDQISILVSIMIKDEKAGVLAGFILMILICAPVVMLHNRFVSFTLAFFLVMILTVVSAKMLRSD